MVHLKLEADPQGWVSQAFLQNPSVYARPPPFKNNIDRLLMNSAKKIDTLPNFYCFQWVSLAPSALRFANIPMSGKQGGLEKHLGLNDSRRFPYQGGNWLHSPVPMFWNTSSDLRKAKCIYGKTAQPTSTNKIRNIFLLDPGIWGLIFGSGCLDV